ncbi:MAG: hypothetical protein NC394_01565 [Bacteroides sp.]|nr:hypothetical protein [Bacteroides sp.]
MDIIKNTPILSPNEIGVAYGIDTLFCFSWLRKANKIYIDNSVLHHYRIHAKSSSHQYDPRQSYSDLYLFNDALDFLAPYGPISENNLFFLHLVYSNAINDTLQNIVGSTLSPSEKLEEYYKILERQVTKECYGRRDENITNNKLRLFYEVFRTFSELEEIPQKWNGIFSAYLPKCCGAVSIQSMRLAAAEPSFFTALMNDSPETVIGKLLALLSQNKYTKQFDLPLILLSLSHDHPLLSAVDDPKFLKKYGDIYLMLYRNKYGEALDAMTDILLKDKVNNETFLLLYVNIAALLEKIDEFIFGKIKTASFLLSAKRFDECREILADLEEMGVQDNDEISDIKARLNEQ